MKESVNYGSFRPKKKSHFGTLLFLHMSSYWCDLSQPTTHLHPTCHPISHFSSKSDVHGVHKKRTDVPESLANIVELGQRLDRGERPPRNWSLRTLVEFQQQSDKIKS